MSSVQVTAQLRMTARVENTADGRYVWRGSLFVRFVGVRRGRVSTLGRIDTGRSYASESSAVRAIRRTAARLACNCVMIWRSEAYWLADGTRKWLTSRIIGRSA